MLQPKQGFARTCRFLPPYRVFNTNVYGMMYKRAMGAITCFFRFSEAKFPLYLVLHDVFYQIIMRHCQRQDKLYQQF